MPPRLAKAINQTFWDDKDGFYYDRNEKTGKQIRVKSVAGFMPLWAGVASRKQAERLVKDHLLNKEEFLKYPIASYAKQNRISTREAVTESAIGAARSGFRRII